MQTVNSTLSTIRSRTQGMVDRFRERYVYSPVFDFAWQGVAAGRVPGGLITCVAPNEHRYPYSELLAAEVKADDMSIIRYEGFAGSVLNQLPTDKTRGVYAVVATQPSVVAESLVARHGNEGVVLLQSLADVTVEQWTTMGVNELLFGDVPPRSLRATLDQMMQARAITAGTPRESIVSRLISEIQTSLDVAQKLYREELRATHAEMDQARAGDASAKRTYDRRDLRLLEWLEMSPRGEALDRLASAYTEVPGMLKNLQPPIPAAPAFDPVMVGEFIREGVKEGVTAAAGIFADALKQSQQPKPEEPAKKSGK